MALLLMTAALIVKGLVKTETFGVFNLTGDIIVLEIIRCCQSVKDLDFHSTCYCCYTISAELFGCSKAKGTVTCCEESLYDE